MKYSNTVSGGEKTLFLYTKKVSRRNETQKNALINGNLKTIQNGRCFPLPEVFSHIGNFECFRTNTSINIKDLIFFSPHYIIVCRGSGKIRRYLQRNSSR